MMAEYIYAVRDTDTGKLISNITNPRRKYWDRKGNCQSAIASFQRGYSGGSCSSKNVEMVTFKLVEVQDDGK